jgi:hypothetical protein
MSWYQAEPFKTLISVVVGGLLAGAVSLATNWWLKRLEIRAKSDALKVAFRGEISALRAALRADVKMAETAILTNAILRTDIVYARVIFDRNAGQIGDIRDTVLVAQLAAFYTLLARIESAGQAVETAAFVASLASAFYMAVILDMKLTAQTAKLAEAPFAVTASGQDALDQGLATEMLKKYGTQVDRRVLDQK